jgi:hypothetical protein
MDCREGRYVGVRGREVRRGSGRRLRARRGREHAHEKDLRLLPLLLRVRSVQRAASVLQLLPLRRHGELYKVGCGCSDPPAGGPTIFMRSAHRGCA